MPQSRNTDFQGNQKKEKCGPNNNKDKTNVTYETTDAQIKQNKYGFNLKISYFQEYIRYMIQSWKAKCA